MSDGFINIAYSSVVGVLFFLVRYIGGWMHHLFMYLIICWNCRMAALMLCYYSMAPCTCKGDISVSAICHLYRFGFRFNIQVGLNRLPLAASVAYPMALHSAWMNRG